MCSRFITPIIFGIQRQRPEERESSCLDSILEIRASMEKPLHTYLHQGEAVQHYLYYSITVWLRVLGHLQGHGEQNQFFWHVLLSNHVEHQENR